MEQKDKKKGLIQKEITLKIGRVIVAFILVMVVAIGLLIASIVNTSNGNEIKLKAEAASWEIVALFQPYIGTIENVAMNPQVQDVLIETTEGKKIDGQIDSAEALRYLKNIAKNEQNPVVAAWIVDLDSSSVMMSNDFISNGEFDASQYEWYSCVEKGGVVYSEPYNSYSAGKNVISIVRPVYSDTDGSLVGIAGIDVALDLVAEAMADYKIGDSGFAVLVSGEGTVAYAPTEAIILKNMKDLAVNEEAIEAVTERKTESMQVEFGGNKEYGSFVPVGDSGYVVLCVMELSEYYESTVLCVVAISIAGLAVCAIVIFSILKTSKKITEPIVELTASAKKLAEGNLDVDIKTSANNEIGELAYYIGQTVERLKEYIVYIDEVSAVLTHVADGDLRIKLENDYVGEFAKLKDSLLGISSRLADVIGGIQDGSNQVFGGADKLAKVSQALAENAEMQTSAVVALMDTTNKITDEVQDSRKKAEESAEETLRVTHKMEENQEMMNKMAEAMNKIQSTSQEVVGIIQAIQQIADQTNLLALNASIEAARAGEAGKGFAVVADEIGKLADESAKAANTTRDLIQVSLEEIEKGNEFAVDVKASLQDAVVAFNKVSEMISQTTQMAIEQAEDMKVVRKEVEDITNAITENSAMAEESSSTSQELEQQASKLNDLVGHFKY